MMATKILFTNFWFSSDKWSCDIWRILMTGILKIIRQLVKGECLSIRAYRQEGANDKGKGRSSLTYKLFVIVCYFDHPSPSPSLLSRFSFLDKPSSG